jgi:hypothetical protein
VRAAQPWKRVRRAARWNLVDQVHGAAAGQGLHHRRPIDLRQRPREDTAAIKVGRERRDQEVIDEHQPQRLGAGLVRPDGGSRLGKARAGVRA